MQFTGKYKTIRPTTSKDLFTAQSLTQFLLGRTWRHSMHTKIKGKERTSLSWPVNPLRHSPRPDTQVHHTAGPAAPSVRVSTNWPLTGPRAQEPKEEKKKPQPSTGETGASMNREEERASRESALYRAGLRPSPHPASGSTSLREASRKGAFLTPDRLTSTNRERAAPPLSFTPSTGDSGGRIKRGKIRREKPHRLRENFCSVNPARVLGRFPARKLS